MAKYYGSDRNPQSPFMRASKKEHTTEQINEWWDTLAKGANEDIRISRDLNQEPQVLFALDDNGRLTPAVKKGEDLGGVDVRGRLLDQARAGRLFIRGLDDDYPRQVQADDQYKVAITKPTNTLPAVEGRLPAKPRSPFILKFCLPFLFREEIQAYRAQKEKYDQAVQRREMIRNFGENVKKSMKESIEQEAKDPKIAQRKEAQTKALQEAWEQRKEQEAKAKEAAEEEWMRNPSEKTLATFENHLRDISIKDFGGVARSVLAKKGSTVGEYCKALAQMLERQVAVPLLDQVDEFTSKADKNAFLLKHQDNYIKMVKHLKLFVPTQIDRERVQNYLQTENPSAAQKNELHQEIRQIAAKGMQGYQNLDPKPEPNQPQEPKLQVQMQQPQLQPQQQIAPPSMGPPQ